MSSATKWMLVATAIFLGLSQCIPMIPREWFFR
jgi:hypothetical protein